jgi:hypothetical protein
MIFFQIISASYNSTSSNTTAMKRILLVFLLGGNAFASLSQTSSIDIQSKEQYRYYLVVNHSDDQLIVKINDAEVYNKQTSNDPKFEDRKEITSFLQKSKLTTYVNKVIVEAHNGPTVFNDFGRIFDRELQHNPWHCKYRIEKVNMANGQVEVLVDKDASGPSPNQTGPGYKAGSWTHEIVKE